MKITRRQLRKIILREIRLKPSIPGAPEDKYAKILDLARSEDPSFRKQADSFADSLGYDPNEEGEIYFPDPEGGEGKFVDFPGQKSSFSEELYQYDNLPVTSPEVDYIRERLHNSGIASFVLVYESELSQEFGKSYSPENLNNILERLNGPLGGDWELEYEYETEQYYFLYDQQM